MLPSEKLKEGENYFYCSTETNILNVSMDVAKGDRRETQVKATSGSQALHGNFREEIKHLFTILCDKSHWDSNSSTEGTTTHKPF